MTILHVEHSQIPGPFRITVEAPDTEADLLGWLWDGDPPEGTELQLVDQQLGYNKFDLTGMNNEVATHLRADAADWLTTANPESYEDFMARRDAEQQQSEEFLASPVPHLGGVTFKEVFDNYDEWKGLRESDGWFVWVGYDPAESLKVPVVEMWELPTEEQVKNDIRWYVSQGDSLNKAVSEDIQLQGQTVRVLVFGLVAGGGGAP